MFLVLYVDDILLIGNDVGVMSSVKVWLSSLFDMKDLGEANFILRINFWQDRKNKMLGLSQARYIDKVLEWFSMQNSKKWLLPFRHGVSLSDDQRPKSQEEENMMSVPYASAVGSLMYAMLCTRPDIYYSIGMVSRYQSNSGPKHWQAVKHILKYLRRMKDYMLYLPVWGFDSHWLYRFRLSIESRFQKIHFRMCFHLGRWSHNLEEC